MLYSDEIHTDWDLENQQTIKHNQTIEPFQELVFNLQFNILEKMYCFVWVWQMWYECSEN